MAELTVDLLLQDARFKKALKDAVKGSKKAGKKVGDNLTDPITRGFASARNQILALAGAGTLTNLFVGAIQAANRQEDAVNSLNSALQRTGEFSKEASKDLLDFADSIQQTSVFGDEAVIEQLALAKAFGLTTEQAKLTTQAAVELSAATGGAITLESAVRNIAKTFSGLKGELGETVASIRNLTAEQLKAGDAARTILAENLGAAASQASTARGRFSQLANAFGDLTEKLGELVTKSEQVSGITKEATNLVNIFTDLFTEKGEIPITRQIEVLEQKIESLREKSKGGAGVGIRSFFVSDDTIARNAKEITELEARISSLRATQEEQRKKALEAAEKNKNNLIQISEQERQAILSQIQLTGLTQEQAIQANYDKQLMMLREALTKRALTQQEFDQRKAVLDQTKRDQENELLANQTIGFDNFFGQVNAGFESLAKTSIVTGKTVANAMVNGIGNAAGSAFSAFGRALVTGENALAAFGDALLAAFGNALIQQGTGFILQGVAQSIAGFGSGAPLIAAGAAMATFGGALTALGGSSAPTPGVSTGQGTVGVGTPSQDIRTDNITEERLEPETRVSLTIQGDVLDSEETGLRIASILEEASLNNNVRVIGGLA